MNQIAGFFVFYACFTNVSCRSVSKGATRFYFASLLSSVGWSFLGTNGPGQEYLLSPFKSWTFHCRRNDKHHPSNKCKDSRYDFGENLLGQNGEIGW
jgi:hypothetical protein